MYMLFGMRDICGYKSWSRNRPGYPVEIICRASENYPEISSTLRKFVLLWALSPYVALPIFSPTFSQLKAEEEQLSLLNGVVTMPLPPSFKIVERKAQWQLARGGNGGKDTIAAGCSTNSYRTDRIPIIRQNGIFENDPIDQVSLISINNIDFLLFRKKHQVGSRTILTATAFSNTRDAMCVITLIPALHSKSDGQTVLKQMISAAKISSDYKPAISESELALRMRLATAVFFLLVGLGAGFWIRKLLSGVNR